MNYVSHWSRAFTIVTTPTFYMMHDATLPALFDVCEEMGLRRGVHFEYVSTREEVLWWNGATTILRSTEHPERLRGPSAAAAWMDEGAYQPEVAFLNLQATLRQPGYPHQLWVTTTPAGKGSWPYQLFFEKTSLSRTLGEGESINLWGLEIHGKGEPVYPAREGIGRYLTFGARTRDNPHGGEAHYQQLIRNFGEGSLLAQQELSGFWVLMEGLTYPMWDRDLFMRPKSEWPVQRPRRIAGGIDFGVAHPAAIVIKGLDEQGNHYLLETFRKKGMDEKQLGDEVERLKEKWGVQAFAADPEDRRWLLYLKHARRLPIMRARKKVGSGRDPSSGIGTITRVLNQRTADGKPMYFVDPACTEYADEMESYIRESVDEERKPVPERPRHVGDDLMDADRYCEMLIAKWWDWLAGGGATKTQQIETRIGS